MLADAILLLHAVIVFFNIAAVPFIWVGHVLKWKAVRNFYFRIVHLLLIAFIAAESVFGAACPLTVWEDQLRLQTGSDARYHRGFVAHWVHRLLFYDLDQWVFAVGYVVFLGLVVFTFLRVKPHWPRRWPFFRRS